MLQMLPTLPSLIPYLLNPKRRQKRPLSADPSVTTASQPYVMARQPPRPPLAATTGREITAKNDIVAAVFFSAERYSEVYTLPS